MFRNLVLLLSLSVALLAAAGPRKIFPYTYSQEDLPNGLRLVTIPTDYPNIVSVFIVVQTGSRNEVEPGKSGFAHLFEHVMFKGTPRFPASKYEEALQEIGAASNAFTSDDLTAYHTTFSKEDLEKVLDMEADRFQNLKYSPETFKTETLAVLGEYNKNSASPTQKLFEVMRDTAFEKHTYKHTTMGFLRDVKDMPQQYEYSLEFFQRYYRPEYVTVIVAGDVQPKAVRALVDKYFGAWKHGTYKPEIPVEPKQNGALQAKVDWPTRTLPWLAIGYRAPAYSDSDKETAALDAIAQLAFSENSELYQKLVLQDQVVDTIGADAGYHVDPGLFSVLARVKKPEAMADVQRQILETVKAFRDKPVEKAKLDAVLKRGRYMFAMRMSNSEAIAQTMARFVALKRTPESVNRLFDMAEQLTPEDIQSVAKKYLIDDGRTIVTLATGGAK